jgi:C-terminal processing protease CtpA/Prc
MKVEDVNALLSGAPDTKVRIKLSRAGLQFDATLVRMEENVPKKPSGVPKPASKPAEPAGKRKLTDREKADR